MTVLILAALAFAAMLAPEKLGAPEWSRFVGWSVLVLYVVMRDIRKARLHDD